MGDGIISQLIVCHSSTPSSHDWQTLLDSDIAVFSLLDGGCFHISINILSSIILKNNVRI